MEGLQDEYETRLSFEEITFVLIAKEAQFTRSNLYKYFNSKEEIFLEFIKQGNLGDTKIRGKFGKFGGHRIGNSGHEIRGTKFGGHRIELN